MNDQERKAETQLPPPPETPSEVAAATGSTAPPPPGGLPDDLGPESDHTMRARGDSYASPEVERLSIQRLLDMNGRVESYMKALLDPKGAFAQNRVQMVTDLSLVVDNGFKRLLVQLEPRFSGIEAKLSKQGEMIHKLELAYEQLKADTSAKLDQLEREIQALKEHRGAEAAAAPTA